MARNKKSRRVQRDGNNSRSYDGRNSRCGADKDDRGANRNSRAYGGNDISWYSRNPNLLAAAASIPYPYRAGMDIPIISDGTGSISAWYVGGSTSAASSQHFELSGMSYRVPGVCRISWIPALGRTATSTDPVNIVARELYSTIRSKYSGSLEVDPPDLMMYLGALDSIFAYIAALKRLYRVLSVWTPDNYYLPDGLMRVLGGSTASDFDQMRAQKTQLWQIINELILQTRKFKCPAVMDLFNRHYWLNDNVYTDAPSINSQMYAFVMEAVLVFEEQATVDDANIKASGLAYKYTPWSKTVSSTNGANFPQGVTVDNLYTFGLNMIRALNQWDDVFTINGYLQRAFESVPSFAVEEIPQDPVFTPVYNEEVLMQIENTRPVPGSYTTSFTAYGVRQNVSLNNVVTADSYSIVPSATEDYAYLRNMAQFNPIINIRSDAPTVADTVIATRMCHAINAKVDGDVVFIQISHATEIVTGVSYQQNVGDMVGANVPAVIAHVYGRATNQWPSDAAVTQPVDAFDWHPIFVEIVVNSALSTNSISVHGDTRNITTLTASQLDEIHRVCVLSEFNAYGNTVVS